MQTFEQIDVGALFTHNGNLWFKKTTRTATLHDGRPGAGPLGRTWTYFRNSDPVNHKLDRHLLPD